MRRYPVLLLCLAACQFRARIESRPDSTPDSLVAERPRFALAAARNDTLACLTIEPDGRAACLDIRSRVDTVRLPTPLPAVVTPPYVFGLFDLFKSWSQPAVPGFSGGVIYAKPSAILTLLAGLKANRVSAYLKLTGDPHDSPSGTDAYRTAGKFDLAKWLDSTDRYNTPVIRAAIAQAVAEGTVLGYSLVDEPNHYSWGGVFTKPLLDVMCGYSRARFPTLPCAVVLSYKWHPEERFRLIDVLIAGTWKETLTPAQWLSAAKAAADSNGMALVPVLNIFGGPPVPGCEKYGDTCVLTPAELRAWAITFVNDPATCGLLMWKYTARPDVYSRPAYQQVFRDVAQAAASRPSKSCRRSS